MAHVCVTGGSGFIGSQVVIDLLGGGHQVRTTVRDPDKAPTDFSIYSDRLELVVADLEDPESFARAFADCEYVVHTASPYVLNVDDAQRDLVDPAVNGTLAVMKAVAATPSVRRVVLTSSFAAVSDEPEGEFDETVWNESSSLTRNPYYYSKTLAEKAAWEFARSQSAFDLVVINPTLVFGPSLIPSINTTNQILVGLLKGEYPGILDIDYPIIDVRDVAKAHRLTMETPSASGRYLCMAETWSQRRLVDWISGANLEVGQPRRIPFDNRFGNALIKGLARFLPAGNRDYLRTTLGRHPRLNTQKIRSELGMTFRPVGETMVDTLLDLKRWGHL